MRARREIKTLAKAAMREQRGTAILLALVYTVVTWILMTPSTVMMWNAGPMGPGGLYWLVLGVGMLLVSILGINLYGEYVKLYQRQKACVGKLFSGFGVNFGRKLGGALWQFLWLWLWGLIAAPVIFIGLVFVGVAAWTTGAVEGPVVLFIIMMLAAFIPMIIRALAYSQMYYILANHPEVQATAALRLSKRMTQGHKGKVFVMGLSFIGWILLMAVPAVILRVISEFVPSTALMILTILVAVIAYIPFLWPYMYTSFAGLFIELRDNAIAEGTIMREELGMVEQEEEQVIEPNRYRADGEGYGSGLGVGMED